MTNLPNSEQSGDLDNIAVTRAQFRSEIGVFLEYVAQALGGVTGNYTTQTIDPQAPILQGAPSLEPGATPPDASRDDRIPSTRWVQEHGRYVGASAPGTPADGMLWVDTSSNPYELQVYNAGETRFDVLSGFPSGTRMLFQQASAPTGWTKDTANDNMALRLTSGTPSIVDSNQAFSTVFTNQTPAGSVSETFLTVNQMPSHSHGVTDPGHQHNYVYYGRVTQDPVDNIPGTADNAGPKTGTTQSKVSGIEVQANGAGEGHTHGFTGTALNLAINYVDVIVAQKN